MISFVWKFTRTYFFAGDSSEGIWSDEKLSTWRAESGKVSGRSEWRHSGCTFHLK